MHEIIAMEFKVELLVVSNPPQKFACCIESLGTASSYAEWTYESITKQLALASVVVVLNTLDALSQCKSANRVVRAILAGVHVVPTGTPALDIPARNIGLDDLLGGSRLCLSDKQHAEGALAWAGR